ncbi:YraN family protein [Patescibacteria group bacterium]|nr:MAG: YraN family protein [Patescibacteria group bacterium]
MDPRRQLGNAGERAAERFLRAKGLAMVARQARTPFGEIDLVCEDGPELVFVEVKTRRSARFGAPEEAITRKKFLTMRLSAEAYVSAKALEARPWRLDVIAIDPSGAITHFPSIDSPGAG